GTWVSTVPSLPVMTTISAARKSSKPMAASCKIKLIISAVYSPDDIGSKSHRLAKIHTLPIACKELIKEISPSKYDIFRGIYSCKKCETKHSICDVMLIAI